MKRIYLLLLACMALLTTASAQKLTVESMTVAGNDISASQYERKDLNGKPCALVKVLLASPGAVFEGNIIGKADYKTGEYWVYMTAGSKELRIKHPSFVPLAVLFSNYGIKGLESKATYVLTLLMPQGGTAPVQTQKLTINYSPSTAMVLVDSKSYQGNGTIVLDLPVGSHEYQIAAVGYETAEGSVKLANTPRTINETLAANAVAQQSTAQQQSITQQNTEQLSASVQQSTIQQQSSQAQTPAAVQSVQNGNVETITVNGVSFNMVRVDGGTFTMGATNEQGSDAYDSEKPAHQVTLSTYSIGETEVTQALWQAVMGSNPSYWQGDNLPVEKVSWEDCQKFIKKLNKQTGKRFRLPTEAEWEYAARGGNKSKGYKYSGSNSINDVAWYIETTNDKRTRPVKTKAPNELGIYDMSGNVYEWCQDWYGSYRSGSQSNPTGSSSGSYRVFRGGSWGSGARDCRVSYRDDGTPSSRGNGLGLRLVL